MTKKELTEAIRTLARIAETPSGKGVEVYVSGATISSAQATVYLPEEVGKKSGVVEVKELLGALKDLKPGDQVSEPLGLRGLTVLDQKIAAHQPVDSKKIAEIDLSRAQAVAVGGAAKNEPRPVLHYLALSAQGLAATDSYRLFIDQSITGRNGDRPPLLPIGLIKALRGPSFQFLDSDQHLTVIGETGTGARVVANLKPAASQYPSIKNILEMTNPEISIKINEQALKAAEQIVADGDKNEVAILEVKGSELLLGQKKIKPTVIGQVDNGAGEMELGVNPAFFRDAVKFVGPEGAMQMEAPLRPISLSAEQRLAIVMPIRILD